LYNKVLDIIDARCNHEVYFELLFIKFFGLPIAWSFLHSPTRSVLFSNASDSVHAETHIKSQVTSKGSKAPQNQTTKSLFDSINHVRSLWMWIE